eukprot:TRINITY_DN32784_c0_g1_i1.p1 TRINITY_DN32784_c0_g1~~TRINITY_DN32784_c0_g1_i1.p1  ORF type:complete len:141 (-),score=2.22 TRINITY_DN32784_c0_g1_i1:365-787(-)
MVHPPLILLLPLFIWPACAGLICGEPGSGAERFLQLHLALSEAAKSECAHLEDDFAAFVEVPTLANMDVLCSALRAAPRCNTAMQSWYNSPAFHNCHLPIKDSDPSWALAGFVGSCPRGSSAVGVGNMRVDPHLFEDEPP